MICPKCRHEKWAEDICPNCGLDQKKALLVMAEFTRESNRFTEASKLYDQFLQLVPEDLEAQKGKATCLYLEGLKDLDENKFQKADEAIIRILEKDWAWEKGHLSRVDLYFHFFKIEKLKKDYEGIATHDENKRIVCQKILEIIRLTSKFHETPPVVRTNISGRYQDFESFFKKYWIMIFGTSFLLWMIWVLAEMSRLAAENKKMIIVFVSFISGLGLLMLFFINIAILRKKSKQKTEKIDDIPKKN